MSGAVRELTSAEGLAPQDGDTLRALKEKHKVASGQCARALKDVISAGE